MSVTPYCNTLFQSCRDLHQFLVACQQKSIEKKLPQIISLSLVGDAIDPLVILHQLSQPDQLNFYYENREFNPAFSSDTSGTAIAAIGSAAQLQVNGPDRFIAAKSFVQATLARTSTAGEMQAPLAGPHFFCSFTFFHNASQQSPFPAATVFLPRWQIVRRGDRGSVTANLTIDATSDLTAIATETWRTVQAITAVKYRFLNPALNHKELIVTREIAKNQGFERAVGSALKSIQAQAFNKVVLAHAVEVASPLPFQLAASLHNLRTLYPDCYIFSSSNGRGQAFLGASPERLVSLHDRQLLTDALAGSAPRGQTSCEDANLANRLLSSPKELHEHQVVIDFITQRLRQLGLSPVSSPLRLLQLPNIQHLHTPIQAAIPADVHLLDIVAELHPTPAVAGVPRAIACEQIRQHETFERSLYAAPIGWVDHRGNGEFAVGIRSALLDGCTARLYAGAGIVAGSTPDRERAEVQLKLKALLAALV